jgi:glycogen operon protein
MSGVRVPMTPSLRPWPVDELGATLRDDGVYFALAAPHAQAVELCLFDTAGQHEIARLPMPRKRDGIWQGVLPAEAGGIEGLIYGWRVHGPWAPAEGHRFNPAKLLLDPYAREVVGRYDGSDIHLANRPGRPDRPDARDNAAQALKARVVADLPPPRRLEAPVDPAERVIYELHVKSLTALHTELPPALRGSYAALGHPVVLRYLRDLGVTTVELLPVAARADEARLLRMGLSNYWGYMPIAWSAPEPRLAAGGPEHARAELHAAIDALHGAGLEVILDVVYNHSAELDENGPTLSLRGIDNALYYHLEPTDPSRYVDFTGCGNSLNLNQPLVLRMVTDSLRRWVLEYGVDGFRFDLAVTLARGEVGDGGSFRNDGAFLSAVTQDPVLRRCVLIAEPWDVGDGGYRVGGFPPPWLEWNDRFRDAQRGFWLRHAGTRGELAYRLAGSSDVFVPAWREPTSSVNFVTAHDGFTLRDLVSYAERHNRANGEDNRDGSSHNLSVNNGVEGPSDRAEVVSARVRQSRALLGVLLLSLGTPMLLAGDEVGHTQQGNNNAYCQDNRISWIDWASADWSLHAYVRELLALRRSLPLLQSRQWWRDAAAESGCEARWLQPDGTPMDPAAWNAEGEGALMLSLYDPAQPEAVLMLINAVERPTVFALPMGEWMLRLRSDEPACPAAPSRAREIGLPAPRLSAHATVPPTALWVATRSVARALAHPA